MIRGLVSIIIPVYNGEKYIERCINYIMGQSYKNIEIIFINDGSTDKTKKLLNKYLDKGRIRYFEQENKGQSAARNVGIRESKGEFIYFFDVDDFIEKNAISRLYEMCEKYDADFVIANTNWIDTYGNEFLVATPVNYFYKNRDEVLEMICTYADDVKKYRNYWCVWNKLYRAKIIKKNKVYFDETMRSIEDIPFVIKYMGFCNSIFLLGEPLYKYIHYGQENLASSRQRQEVMGYVKQAEAFEQVLCSDKYEAVLKNCYSEFAIWTIYRQVQLTDFYSLSDLYKLYIDIKLIVNDKRLQESILYYVQKHNDNARNIPELIKKRQVCRIIFVFWRQINKLKHKK